MLFYHMLNLAVTNALVFYNWGRMEKEEKAITENCFRDGLILQIIERYHAQPIADQCTPVSVTTIPAAHECRVRHGSTLTPHKDRCCYCQQNSQQSWTFQHCLDCPFSPALCQIAKRDYHALWHSPGLEDGGTWISTRLACWVKTNTQT